MTSWWPSFDTVEEYKAYFASLPKPGFLPAGYVAPAVLPKGYTMDQRFQVAFGEDGCIIVIWSMGRAGGGQGEMRVWYEPDGDRVARLQVSLPDGLTPKDLSRFQWT